MAFSAQVSWNFLSIRNYLVHLSSNMFQICWILPFEANSNFHKIALFWALSAVHTVGQWVNWNTKHSYSGDRQWLLWTVLPHPFLKRCHSLIWKKEGVGVIIHSFVYRTPFFRAWLVHVPFSAQLSIHYSEKRGLCLMECPSVMIQNLSCFWNMISDNPYSVFHFMLFYFFVDIDQGINYGKKLAWNENHYMGFHIPKIGHFESFL